MPHYAIHALDHAGAVERRLAHYEAHKAYLGGDLPVRIVVSGPLLAEDGATMIGSLFIVEAPDRAAVEAFHAADPFKAAGIWERVAITAFRMRQVALPPG